MNQPTIVFDTNHHTLLSSNDPTMHSQLPKKPCNKKSMKSYTSVIHHPRRLGSGSACERCRSRKTKCDGGRPCAFCASHGVPCIHRPSNRKRKPSPRSGFRDDSAKERQQQQHILKPFQDNKRSPTLIEQRKQSYFETVISSKSSISSQSSISSVNSNGVNEEATTYKKYRVDLVDANASNSWGSASATPTATTTNIRIPSIMDQLSCHTFTIEAAYSSCSSNFSYY